MVLTMATGAGGYMGLLLMAAMVSMVSRAQAWSVSCSNPASTCYGVLQTCPNTCVNWCKVDCTTCLVKCGQCSFDSLDPNAILSNSFLLVWLSFPESFKCPALQIAYTNCTSHHAKNLFLIALAIFPPL